MHNEETTKTLRRRGSSHSSIKAGTKRMVVVCMRLIKRVMKSKSLDPRAHASRIQKMMRKTMKNRKSRTMRPRTMMCLKN